MIDRMIQWIALSIIKNVLPSTIMKTSIVAIIVAFLLSIVIGYGLIILALVVCYVIWASTEYMYALEIEQEDDEG